MHYKRSFQRWVLIILLSPLSAIYGVVISLRNMLYDAEIIKPTNFSIPIISVGNLAIGGAGKTPHIEYLVNLLNPYINVSILSRGYNRETVGFRFVSPHDTANISGDEPLMYARKFNDITVAVGENRALAIPQMLQKNPHINVVLLDDAYQHRSVQPYKNILLTQYESPFTKDFLLPSGRLREWRSAYKRADIIIISKCPDHLTIEEKQAVIKEIKPLSHQKIYFSKYIYNSIYHFYDPRYSMNIQSDHDIMMISAIANTSYLIKYLEKMGCTFESVEFEDHHVFNEGEVNKIIEQFNQRQKPIKYILTTEKDAVRLLPFRAKLLEAAIPIYVLPISVVFLEDDHQEFDKYIKQVLLDYVS
jgi:tetraacyldisaccharide 4'-kinase